MPESHPHKNMEMKSPLMSLGRGSQKRIKNLAMTNGMLLCGVRNTFIYSSKCGILLDLIFELRRDAQLLVRGFQRCIVVLIIVGFLLSNRCGLGWSHLRPNTAPNPANKTKGEQRRKSWETIAHWAAFPCVTRLNQQSRKGPAPAQGETLARARALPSG